jgi:hypothetical protein
MMKTYLSRGDIMKNSKFTGSAWGLFGWNLLIAVSSLLFFIPLAYVYPRYVKWYVSNVTIDDEQLNFDYEGPWWGVIGWMLFSVITFGIGAFYASKKMMQWQVQHTYTPGNRAGRSYFSGDAWGIFAYSILTMLSIYAFIIPIAWTYVALNRWYHQNTIISGKGLKLDYKGPWFGVLGWALFAFVTLGFGAFYAQKKQIQFIYEHTHFESNG